MVRGRTGHVPGGRGLRRRGLAAVPGTDRCGDRPARRRVGGLRRGLADRLVHPDRGAVRGRAPGRVGDVQLRRKLHIGPTDQRRGAGGCVRRGQPGHHADRDRCRRQRRRTRHVRPQPARHRGAGRQPGRHHRPGRPRRTGGDGGPLCRAGAVWRGGGHRAGGRRGRADAGDAGAGCPGGPVPSGPGRGRRGTGVPHGRGRRRRRRGGCRVPGVGQRRQRLSHRGTRRGAEPGGGAGVRGVCALRGRSRGVDRGRLPGAVNTGGMAMSIGDDPGPGMVSPPRAGRRGEPARRRGTGPGVPLVLVVPAMLGLGFLGLPLVGLLIRTPWSALPARLTAPGVVEALRLSLFAATAATVLCLLLGVPLAWLLARVDFPGSGVVRALVTVPLVLPPAVGGVALLLVFGRRGVVGVWLEAAFGLTIPFTTLAVVLAEAFVAMPFLVIAVEGALRGADRRYEEAAATLGAGRWTTFRRVTFPLVGPGIAA